MKDLATSVLLVSLVVAGCGGGSEESAVTPGATTAAPVSTATAAPEESTITAATAEAATTVAAAEPGTTVAAAEPGTTTAGSALSTAPVEGDTSTDSSDAKQSGFPDGFSAALIPPGISTSSWESSGAGEEVTIETTATFEEIVAFYKAALGEPSKVTLDEEIDKALWLSTAGHATQITVIVRGTDPVSIVVSGLLRR